MRRTQVRGFTLVELMIVVAIIGVLAAVAVTGVRRYLSASKSSEGKNNVGEIARAAHAAFEREQMSSEVLPEGSISGQANHQLCGSAAPVPAAVPKATKYQPSTAVGADFKVGDSATGWACLHFEISQPIYFQYAYTRGQSPVVPQNPAACTGNCFEAAAKGDTDGNDVFVAMARTGFVDQGTGELRLSTILFVDGEGE